MTQPSIANLWPAQLAPWMLPSVGSAIDGGAPGSVYTISPIVVGDGSAVIVDGGLFDSIYGSDLMDYVLAIAGMWAQTDEYLEDPDNDVVDFQALLDVDLAPTAGLPYLAQYVGERVPIGSTDAQAREWIRESPKWSRGTPQAIFNAVKRVLAPGATMMLRERHKADGTPDPDWIALITFTATTPDPALVEYMLRQNVPADIMIDYEIATVQTWGTVATLGLTYGGVLSSFETWAGVAAGVPNYDVFS